MKNAPYKTSATEVSQKNFRLLKSDLVKEVCQSAEEAQRAQEKARAEVIDEDYQEYCQTKGPSLYQLLEEIRDLALLDVSADIRTWTSNICLLMFSPPHFVSLVWVIQIFKAVYLTKRTFDKKLSILNNYFYLIMNMDEF